MEDLSRQVCQRIKTLRIDHCGPRGRADFARKLGLSPSTYNYYEQSRVPPAETLVHIAEATGARLDWLLAGREPRYGAGDAPAGLPSPTGEILREAASVLQAAPQFGATLRAFLDTLREAARLPAEKAGHRATGRASTLDPRHLVPIVGYTAATPAHFWEELGRDPSAGDFDRKIEALLFSSPAPSRLPARVGASDEAAPQDTTAALVQFSAPDARGVVEALDAPQIRSRYPDAVAWRVDGDSMSPRFEHGDIVVGSSRVPARPNHPCIARLRGQIGVVCKLFQPEGNRVRLAPLNPGFPTQDFSRDQVEWAVAVLWSVRVGKRG